MAACGAWRRSPNGTAGGSRSWCACTGRAAHPPNTAGTPRSADPRAWPSASGWRTPRSSGAAAGGIAGRSPAGRPRVRMGPTPPPEPVPRPPPTRTATAPGRAARRAAPRGLLGLIDVGEPVPAVSGPVPQSVAEPGAGMLAPEAGTGAGGRMPSPRQAAWSSHRRTSPRGSGRRSGITRRRAIGSGVPRRPAAAARDGPAGPQPRPGCRSPSHACAGTLHPATPCDPPRGRTPFDRAHGST